MCQFNLQEFARKISYFSFPLISFSSPMMSSSRLIIIPIISNDIPAETTPADSHGSCRNTPASIPSPINIHPGRRQPRCLLPSASASISSSPLAFLYSSLNHSNIAGTFAASVISICSRRFSYFFSPSCPLLLLINARAIAWHSRRMSLILCSIFSFFYFQVAKIQQKSINCRKITTFYAHKQNAPAVMARARRSLLFSALTRHRTLLMFSPRISFPDILRSFCNLLWPARPRLSLCISSAAWYWFLTANIRQKGNIPSIIFSNPRYHGHSAPGKFRPQCGKAPDTE